MAENEHTAENDVPERVEAILRRYGVAERDIGACCDDLSPHLRPPGSPRGLRYADPRPTPPAEGSGYCLDTCSWPHDHRFERDGIPWPARTTPIPPGKGEEL